MHVHLKPLHDQVMVITGATSGIGLSTARLAAAEGAALVLAARSERDLRELVSEIQTAGGRASCVVADVGREDDVRRIADEAHRAFGGFDTWVNNAGVSVYGLALERAPISVTLIKPAAIDTPYTRHAKNYLDDQPTLPPPVYTPESVAEAILHAASTPVRELFVGGGSKAASTLHRIAPALADRLAGRLVIPASHSGQPRKGGEDGLHQAAGGLQERGDYDGMVRDSLYTKAAIHPVLTSMAFVGAGVLVANWLRSHERAA